jgi:hypothetical protein
MVEINYYGTRERSQSLPFTQREFLICNESEACRLGARGGGEIILKFGPNIFERLRSPREIDGHCEWHASLTRQCVFAAVPPAKRVARIKVRKTVTH